MAFVSTTCRAWCYYCYVTSIAYSYGEIVTCIIIKVSVRWASNLNQIEREPMVIKLSELETGFLEFVQLFGFRVICDQPPDIFILATERIGCERTPLEKFSLKTWCYMCESYFLSRSRKQSKFQKTWWALPFHCSSPRWFWISWWCSFSFPVFGSLPHLPSPSVSIHSSSSPYPFTPFVQFPGLLLWNSLWARVLVP